MTTAMHPLGVAVVEEVLCWRYIPFRLWGCCEDSFFSKVSKIYVAAVPSTVVLKSASLNWGCAYHHLLYVTH